MLDHHGLYVRIAAGVPRGQVFQRVRELLAEDGGRYEVRLYRQSRWVEVLCAPSAALWRTVSWLSGQLQGEVVALEARTEPDTLSYHRSVGGQRVRELSFWFEGGVTRGSGLSMEGQAEPWEEEVFAPFEAARPGAPRVWMRDAQQGERHWEDVPVPVGSAAHAFGVMTRELGLPAGEGALRDDVIEQSVVIPGVRPSVEERGQRPPGVRPLSAWGVVGAVAVVAAFLWLAVGGVRPVEGGTWAALLLAWVGYSVLLRRHSGVIAFGGGFIATCLTLIAAIPFSRAPH